MSQENVNETAILITVAAPNPAEMETLGQYAKESFDIANRYGANILSRYTSIEQIHGEAPAAIIGLAEFPSAETIKEMFDSKEYKALLPMRDKALTSLNLYIAS